MNEDKISLYEAENVKIYTWLFPGTLITLKDKVGSLINGTWIYSGSWKENWVQQATDDAYHELSIAKERVAQLELALKLLNKVEVEK